MKKDKKTTSKENIKKARLQSKEKDTSKETAERLWNEVSKKVRVYVLL